MLNSVNRSGGQKCANQRKHKHTRHSQSYPIPDEEKCISADAMLKDAGIDSAALSDAQFESFVQQKWNVRVQSMEEYQQGRAMEEILSRIRFRESLG